MIVVSDQGVMSVMSITLVLSDWSAITVVMTRSVSA